MALHKVLGVETEYGIIVRGGDSNPIAASSVLINAYVQELARTGTSAGATRVGWDFEDEQPGNDARGFSAEGQMPPEVETHLVNAVLTNGARYYVDHAHPELSTPECADPRTVVVYDRAAELILHRSMEAATALLPPGQEIAVYKNNSDRKGNSYGTHENYLMDRAVPFSKIVSYVMPHFITRQIFTGAGKVGTEAPGLTSADVPFQLTQRADFFEEEVGLETTLKRPIVNTRDEPHADAQKYRRLHVIVGDANLAEVATYLKVGTTALVLPMIEDDWLTRDLLPAKPVQALRHVSYDMTLERPDRAGRRLVDHRARGPVGALRPGPEVRRGARPRVHRWRGRRSRRAHPLGGGPHRARDRPDDARRPGRLDRQAPAARRLPRAPRPPLGRREAGGHGPPVPRPPPGEVAGRPGRAGADRTDEEATRAMTEPPPDTRAYFRGKCLQRWPDEIVAANWDSLVFDVGGDPLRRVPMMEPLRGTEAHVGSLIDSCETAADLLEKLGQ